ncbi:hypothetical protein I4U23_010593 [Adineta vaga]|nr:hypothetical protein I4U23_010593 [Adineta vaga]
MFHLFDIPSSSKSHIIHVIDRIFQKNNLTTKEQKINLKQFAEDILHNQSLFVDK